MNIHEIAGSNITLDKIVIIYKSHSDSTYSITVESELIELRFYVPPDTK